MSSLIRFNLMNGFLIGNINVRGLCEFSEVEHVGEKYFYLFV